MPLVEMYKVAVEVEMPDGSVKAVSAYFDSVPTLDEFMECHDAGLDGVESWVAGLHAAASVIVSRGLPCPNGSLPPAVSASFCYPDGSVTVTRTGRWVSEAVQTEGEQL